MLSRRATILLMAAFAVSLATNFALVGFMAARSFPKGPRMAPAERFSALGPRLLPAPLAAAATQRLQPDSPALRDALAAVRDARRDVILAMRATPYDRVAVAGALSVLHQRIDALSALADMAVLDALDTASDEDRAAIGQRRGN